MKNEIDFKFEPIWLTILSVLMLLLLYKCFNAYNSNQSIGLFLALITPVILVSLFVLPLGFKMILGIPAIALTNEYFVINYNGLSIDWHDIADIHITTNYKGISTLIINLKQPEKYFGSSLKKIKYQIRQIFTANDIIIPIDLISGKNEAIFQTVNAYWTKSDKF
ncbi:MAG TPA: STM3941 family protein [Mucilaginibacter sp.]|jgi:hypothetical protein|nr:STM3941 family protein [Mucilaginibacter sp.]